MFKAIVNQSGTLELRGNSDEQGLLETYEFLDPETLTKTAQQFPWIILLSKARVRGKYYELPQAEDDFRSLPPRSPA